MSEEQAPRGVQFLAGVYFLMALALPLQMIWIHKLPLGQLHRAFTFMPLGNWLVCLLALASAYHLITYSHRSFYLLPVALGITVLNNWWVSYAGSTFSSDQTWLASGLLVSCHAALAHPRAFKALKKNTPKPWRQPPRFLLSYPTTLIPPTGPAVILNSHDLSLTGMFLCSSDIRAPRGYLNKACVNHIHEGTEVSLRVQIDQLRTLRIEAQVVRKVEDSSEEPPGLALRFHSMDKNTRRWLRERLR